ncbi:hypothetical protein [Mycobacterium pseudokansasii]|uniref:hypothetical protein n=1 Tax=Mycobacterium pseudokansasii TaxID=2341080 RepID=UPI000F01B916|nr:hypothetical protein [Mycobacterium pseudokansasii]VBA34308.1 hypothetical protein LAUMK35_05700 [Mycobacterium pseudokansasii]VBA35837.1 hypothetical protein LAUMK21_05707 [Mycobacterium pseudokansasii]
MPSYSRATRILRDDLTAQLRRADRPLTTAELRDNAPRVPHGPRGRLAAPISEQIYRTLCALEREDIINRAGSSGRTITWAPTITAALRTEIADLEAAFAVVEPADARGSQAPQPAPVPADPARKRL